MEKSQKFPKIRFSAEKKELKIHLKGNEIFKQSLIILTSISQ